MAFKKIDLSDLSKILDYSQFLKKSDDQSITMYQKDGVFFNATRIEPVEEKKDNHHQEIDVKRDQ